METICSIIRGTLAPAGNPIQTSKEALTQPLVEHYHSVFTDSGTSALALALLVIKNKFPHISKPEVIIPGYGCPDLISAAQYAQVKPVIIDTDTNSPFYNIEALEKTLSNNTIAILTVNFLGIPENRPAIQKILLKNENPAIIIDDNAQWFPENSDSPLSSTLSIISFGRGKPVSILGGGALLCKNQEDATFAQTILSQPPRSNAFKETLKIHLYNQLIKPFYYQFLTRNPLLNLGKTTYRPLQKIESLTRQKHQLIQKNLHAHLQRSRSLEETYLTILQSDTEYEALINTSPLGFGRLLRFPILCRNKAARDELILKGHSLGLGFSAMYQTGMSGIETLPPNISPKSLPNSNDFADRLLTLPLHDFVTPNHVKLIKQTLRKRHPYTGDD
ncbi:MAG: DegT/DnrJ/EryC1/StrS family aminotransferase [Cellvibrionaceae bacterium]